MAELIPTEEEKQSDTYLNWDNESLGKLVRRCAFLLGDREGIESTYAMSAAYLLVCQAIRLNATESKFDIEGFTSFGKPEGDWEIVVRQVKNPNGSPVDVMEDANG